MLFQAALLGVVQGLTEFLPISSSAHLILARAFFGWDTEQFGIAFDVACHMGTLLAVIVYFTPELTNMVRALPRAFRRGDDPAARQIWLLAAGTLPIVPAGLLFSRFEEVTRTPVVAGIMLAVGGALLWMADRIGTRTRSEDGLRMVEAVGLGLAQAAALVPGVSRSGATMTLGLLLGLRRDAAARFSFLLGIPAMLAAAGYESLEVAREGLPAGSALLFVVGAVTAGVVGFLAVKYFLRYVSGHSLTTFAIYRFALAAAVALWALT
jgi:undecaprenyl-diphosphatase